MNDACAERTAGPPFRRTSNPPGSPDAPARAVCQGAGAGAVTSMRMSRVLALCVLIARTSVAWFGVGSRLANVGEEAMREESGTSDSKIKSALSWRG